MDIGWGHAVRCGSLAAALIADGMPATLVAREIVGGARVVLDAMGVPCTFMARTCVQGSADDASALCAIAAGVGARMAIIDVYAADAPYLAALDDAGLIVGVIDDEGVRDLARADWILNQNLGASSRTYPGVAERLIGPDAALLRPEFACTRAGLHRTFHISANRVIVTLGGGDTIVFVRALFEAFERVDRRLEIRCYAPAGWRPPASKHVIVQRTSAADIAADFGWADVAISGGGSTLWELCCVGVPIVLTILAENQRGGSEALVAAGCAVDCGNDPAHAATLAAELLAHPGRRANMSQAASRVVDGGGAGRAAASIRSLLTRRGILQQ